MIEGNLNNQPFCNLASLPLHKQIILLVSMWACYVYICVFHIAIMITLNNLVACKIILRSPELRHSTSSRFFRQDVFSFQSFAGSLNEQHCFMIERMSRIKPESFTQKQQSSMKWYLWAGVKSTGKLCKFLPRATRNTIWEVVSNFEVIRRKGCWETESTD